MSWSFLLAVFLPPLVVTTAPAVFVSVLFGAKGLVYLSSLALMAIVTLLGWGFLGDGFQEQAGFEVLWLILYPLWWLVGSLWSGVVHLILGAVRKRAARIKGRKGATSPR